MKRPRIGVLVADPTQRYALRTTVRNAGFEVNFCGDAQRGALTGCGVDFWLVSNTEASTNAACALSEMGKCMRVEGPIPSVVNAEFGRWQTRFQKQLQEALLIYHHQAGHVRAAEVWLLAASTGGVRAVGQFLALARPSREVGFVYAQHIVPEQVDQLARMVERNSAWRAEVATTGRFVAAGHVAIMLADKRVTLSAAGEFRIRTGGWGGHYRPNIDQVADELADYYGRYAGMIVFTGMGDDAVMGSAKIKACGGTVWVQQRETCTVAAMPEAVLTRGAWDVEAEIPELARRFNDQAIIGLPPAANARGQQVI